MNRLKFSFVALFVLLVSASACKSTAPTSPATTMKANLIDGSWEANYIINLPKGFEELFPKGSPTITFNSKESKVNGNAGCNNFMGSFTIDGNQLDWIEGMAVTRKMCPDMSGEQAFLETLNKVNSYSISEQGNILNLIMGDIAVMRLSRK